MSMVRGYGVYLPETRIEAAELMKFHGRKGRPAAQWLAVPDLDEDTITMAFEAATAAMAMAGLEPGLVDGLVWGSLSPPFGLKSPGTLLAKALGLPDGAVVVGLNSGTKLAAEAILTAHGLVEAGVCRHCLVVCADFLATGGPLALDLAASAGAAALVMGREGFARLEQRAGHLDEVYDLWSLPGEARPRHDAAAHAAGYINAAGRALGALRAKAGLGQGGQEHLVLHAPGGPLTAKVAKALGLGATMAQETAAKVGNLFSASLLVGLAQAFEAGRPGEAIVAVGYGSGSADALLWRMERPAPAAAETIEDRLAQCRAIDMARHQRVAGC